MTPRISAVLITKNEGEMLERRLDSLTVLDQIVVYDTGSTDRTPKIARSAGVTVIRGTVGKPFHFANTRNVPLKHATTVVVAEKGTKAADEADIHNAVVTKNPERYLKRVSRRWVLVCD